MQNGSVTTPFGRRPMTLVVMKRQLASADIPAGKTVDKWKVFRDACEARALLGVQDRALAVLDALLTFYPRQELSQQDGLVVFPSNAQLSVRAHGIAETTLRRQLASLVEAGLITRKDSPNGKRYARKDGEGDISDAFGFSLAPLLARAEELALLAQQVAAERRRFQLAKEEVSLCRRDIRKLIAAAVDEGISGEWSDLIVRLEQLLARIPRTPAITDLLSARDGLVLLRLDVLKLLELKSNSAKASGNDGLDERHIQNSNTQHIPELEPRFETKQGAADRPQSIRSLDPPRSFPLEIVLKACKDIADYGPEGMVRNWRDLMSAAVVVRSMLGVSPSAYQEACEVMGPENAAVAIACILERSTQINSAGGYLRDLTARMENGSFSLGPMIMALLRAHGHVGKKAS